MSQSMDNNQALVTVQESIVYSPEQVQLIKDVYAKGATNNELALFIEVAQRKGLDIFSRQIHLVKRYDSQLQREVMEPQTGIDGYRLMAERTRKHEGQIGPFWCGSDGEWKDVWLSVDPPAAAKVGTLRTGCREPFWAVALYKEYVQTRKDGTPNAMWRKMAANQLAKCAEALSLRKAFPSDLAGVYTQEEMAQVSNGVTSETAPDDVMTKREAAQFGQHGGGLNQWKCGGRLAMELIGLCTRLEAALVSEETWRAWLPEGVTSRKNLTEEQARQVIHRFRQRLETIKEADNGKWKCKPLTAIKLVEIYAQLRGEGINDETIKKGLPKDAQSFHALSEEQAQEALENFAKWLDKNGEAKQGEVVNG